MKDWLRRLLVTALILGVSAGAFAFIRRNGGAKKDEVRYETAEVTIGDVRSFVSATGVIQPWKVVDVKSNVGGRIDRLTKDIGDRVKRGEVLMVIDPTDQRAEYDQAEADHRAARARLQQAWVSLRQQELQTEARIQAATKSVSTAEARLAEAEASMKAQPKLTASSIQQAEATLESARKAVVQAQQNRRQLEEQLAQLQDVTIPNNIAAVESNLQQAKANTETAEAEYRRQQQLLAQGYVSKSDVEAAYARLATLRAQVRTAEQRLQTLQRENELALRELHARIDQAQSQIEESQARVRQAEAALEAARTNQVQNDIRRHEWEAAKAALEQAKAELASAQAEREQIKIRTKEITAAQAQIVRTAAARDRAKTNLTYTVITAPRDGVIITKNVEEGTVIPSSRGSIGGTNALLQIGDISRLWIVCNVDETDIGQVSVGQKVTIRVDAYPSMLVDGKVIRIDPKAIVEQNVTMIPVTVEIAEPDERFKPGMNATCEFIVDEALGVLTVPNEALKETEGIYKVQKMVNGKPQEVEVEVGLAGQDVTEIRSGLQAGDVVVTKVIEPEQRELRNPFGGPFGSGRGMGRSLGSSGSGGGSR